MMKDRKTRNSLSDPAWSYTGFRLYTADKAMFNRLYSHCMQRFLRNAVHMAINDSLFFQKVFFYGHD